MTPARAGRRRLGLLWVAFAVASACRAEPFRPHPIDPQHVLDAIAAARPLDLGGAAVTGLTLPHHRVASDLIATGMVTAAQGPAPERIVLLTPDHFKRSPRPFATTTRDFDTVLGRVPTDRAAAAALLRSPEVAPSVLFEREHGVGELLPYVARLFPGVPVLPLAVAIHSTRAQWERLLVPLRPWITPRTLVVQSTDFSHYLPREQAAVRDQQMLNVLAAGDLDALARALQPAQIDSRGSQYLQLRLQAEAFGAAPIVFGNYNSADPGATPADNTTSYVAQVYAPAARGRVVRPAGDATLLCVAGDTFFGRHLAQWLADERVRERVRETVRERLQGCPLLVNLEGVLADGVAPAAPMQLVMPAAQTLQWLRELGVAAVSVANNHSRDLGDDAYAAMVARLREAGFVVLEHGRPQTVGPLRVVAFSDVDNPPRPARERLTAAELQALRAAGAAPELAFVHWGREFVAEPGARERALALRLHTLGVPLLAGAHPHRASRSLALLGGPDGAWAYSLGNFVFDQRAPRATGAVLQISVFAQGTRALRLLPWPDVDALGRAAREVGR
jgi:poly-gamma-glutamate synthesis protein (capsule biosynthesis protein)